MMHLEHIPNLRPNERVVLLLRRYWFALLNIFSAFSLLLIVPLALGWYFADTLMIWLEDPFFGPMIMVFGCIYFLCVWLFAFLEFTDYYLDTWIITNERVLNNEQDGLFKRTASELDLASVQDITAETHGILQTLFTYGNVLVQTAGEQTRFHFKNVNDPEKVKTILMRLVEEKRGKRNT